MNPTDTSLIISGSRNQKPKDLDNFAIQSYAKRLGPKPLVDYLQASSMQISSISTGIDEVPRIHQSQLLPLLETTVRG
jgi:hypothetical protein